MAISVGIGYFSLSIGKTPLTALDHSFSVMDKVGTAGVGNGVGVAVGVGIGVGVGGVGVGSTGLKTGFNCCFGAALMATPLFQTSLLPDLMQVNFLPVAITVAPALVHLAPAFGFAAWTGVARANSKLTTSQNRKPWFNVKASVSYLRKISW